MEMCPSTEGGLRIHYLENPVCVALENSRGERAKRSWMHRYLTVITVDGLVMDGWGEEAATGLATEGQRRMMEDRRQEGRLHSKQHSTQDWMLTTGHSKETWSRVTFFLPGLLLTAYLFSLLRSAVLLSLTLSLTLLCLIFSTLSSSIPL